MVQCISLEGRLTRCEQWLVRMDRVAHHDANLAHNLGLKGVQQGMKGGE
jgi:hypothetical protein